MPKYRKKPVVIQAFEYDPHPATGIAAVPMWFIFEEKAGKIVIKPRRGKKPYLVIKTLEGNMKAEPGDFIIRGVVGEIYPCKPDIFKRSYEECLG